MRTPWISAAILLVLAAAMAAVLTRHHPSAIAQAVPDDALVQRGSYLVNVIGCSDCHTPFKMGEQGPEPDMDRYLSGHPQQLMMPPAPKLPEGPWLMLGAATNTAFAGPWGVSYAINLTPDRQTGIGAWTFEMFKTTIREGKHMGAGRPIMPPMPWPHYRNLTDDDLAAVWAYLQSLPPITNQAPDYQPPDRQPAPYEN